MRYVALLAILFGCCALPADAAPYAKNNESPLRIDSHVDLNVTAYTEILEDPHGTLSLRDALSSNEWHAGSRDALVFGFSKSVWWVRLRAINQSNKHLTAVLDLGNPLQDYVTWFVVRREGEFVEEVSSGDRLPRAHRPLPVRNFALPLAFAPNESVEVVMRLQSYDGVFDAIPLRLSNRETFFTSTGLEDTLLAVYHGGFLALALYNLLLFVATRERAFGWYVLYLALFLAWSLASRGLTFQYLWPNFPTFNNDFLAVVTAWSFAASGCFTVSYLRLRSTAPRWLFNTVFALIGLNTLASLPALRGHYALTAGMSLVTGTSMAIVTLGAAIWLLRLGSRQARFYVLAFTAIVVGSCCYSLQLLSVLPTNWFTNWGVQIGSAIEVLLLALGLADSMNTLKAEKIEAERRAREAQESLNAQLARQVTERTEALELANRRLHELAITDELTGAFNRRHFSAFCGAALTHRDRNEPLAFCIFDIDYFRSFNERYGHEVGNAALRSIAQTMRSKLRRSADVLFRLGGEEFGILFTANSAEAARQFVDKLRLAVRDLGIQHEDNPAGVLTASFGVGWWDVSVTERLTPNQMYAVADNMVYEAKDGGRDRVAIEAITESVPEADSNDIAHR